MNLRYWSSVPVMALSSIFLAQAIFWARVGDVISGGYWSESSNGGFSEVTGDDHDGS